MRVDITMFVEDGNNSAGIIVDCIRISKIAKDRQVGGVLQSACSFFMKHPPKQLQDYIARRRLKRFIQSRRDR